MFKEDLQRIKYIEVLIKSNEEKLLELYDLRDTLPSAFSDDDRVSTSRNISSQPERLAIKIVDYERKIKQNYEELIRIKLNMMEEINSLDDEYKTILTLRYVDCMSWNKISKILNYAVPTLYEKHREAIKELEGKNERLH